MRLIKDMKRRVVCSSAAAVTLLALAQPVAAQYVLDPPPYLMGQVIMFAGNYCPLGFLPANGQVLPISQYPALADILGSVYGGDGQTTFGLPNLSPISTLGYNQVVNLCISYEVGAFPQPPTN